MDTHLALPRGREPPGAECERALDDDGTPAKGLPETGGDLWL
jgi:hypothetical protein